MWIENYDLYKIAIEKLKRNDFEILNKLIININ